MLILQIFFIDLITFSTAFTPPACLFEIRFVIASSFLPKTLINLQNDCISPLCQLWNQSSPAHFFLIPSWLWRFLLQNFLPISMNDLLDGKFRIIRPCNLFWLDFWHHLFLFILKGKLNLKAFLFLLFIFAFSILN